MYPQFNEQFATAARQFADTAAQINRLTLENAQAVLGLQLSAIEDRAEATVDDNLKLKAPKGVQIARENVERAVSTGQEAFGRTLKTNEAIADIAKSQIEATAKATRENVEANVEKATKAAGKAAK